MKGLSVCNRLYRSRNMATLRTILNLNSKLSSNFIIPVRNGHIYKGKPPGIAKSLEQKMEELKYKDPETSFKVDIGLPQVAISRSDLTKEKLEIIKANRQNRQLEKLSREKKLELDLDGVRKEWQKRSAPQIRRIADHYQIFDHLFGDAYFLPRVPTDIHFQNEDGLIPVYYGNVIKPTEAKNAPTINYESDKDTLWTLILTNPDGHFTKQESEYVHWFIGNIQGSDITKGETIINYLQPFPPKGTGYHRHVFILYKQNERIDYSSFKREGECYNLSERTFSTLDFYRERQDVLTPAGLAFFQSDWDRNLKDFYHNKLNMKEPIFEYDFPPPYIRPQEWYPLRKPFNLYLDKYRDPKQINKEFLMRKLKDVHPFNEPEPELMYPNAQYFNGYKPTWLKLEIRKSRLKEGRINEIVE